jgi:di/tricarboxylate transporter
LLTIVLFGAAVLIGAVGLVPLSIAFLSAAVLTILMRCISVERATEFVDWRLLVLIGGHDGVWNGDG